MLLGGNALRKVPLVAFTCYSDPTPKTVNSITTQFSLVAVIPLARNAARQKSRGNLVGLYKELLEEKAKGERGIEELANAVGGE